MSKYNRLPGLKNEEPIVKEAPKMPVSKLCCLPILMEGNKNYKNQLSSLMSLEELLPRVQRMQIYQMMYMDKLLNELKDYRPDIDTEPPKDPMEIIAKIDKSKKTVQMAETFSKIMKYNQSKDMSVLMELIAPNNPMISMLLPMLSMGKGSSANMMESLLPMMMGGGNMDLSSILGMM